MTTTTEITHSNGVQNGNGAQVQTRTVPPQMLITSEHREMLRQMIDRNATDAQIETLIVVGNRYDLDPLMGHVVLISGKCFVTHEGLIHKAHTSGQFDGMETIFGKDEIGEYSETKVWRKDMTRPFVGRIYLAEYANNNPVWKSCRHGMAAKTSESFVMRRAMDVSLTSQEEMGEDNSRPINGSAAGTRPAAPRPLGSTAHQASSSQAAPSQAASNQAASNQSFSNTCEVCEKPMPPGQVTLSMTKYGRPLCPVHQRSGEEATPAAQAPAAADRSTANTANDDPFEDGGGLEGGGHG